MALLPDLTDYEVVGRLAVGGMAEIYRARAKAGPLAGGEVVLKRLLPVHRSDPGYVELFLAEAKLGVLLVHPNIVRTFDLFRAGLDYFIVQELVGGDTLGRLRRRAKQQGGRLSLPAVAAALQDALAALDHLHAGGSGAPVVHRDVNPENLVAAPHGAVKLIDMGIAEHQGAAQRARTGALRGTPAYMSPEQVRGRPLDARSDLFSAGILLWELVANRPLFHGDSEFETLRHVAETVAPPLRAVQPQLPATLERLCVRALAREPERRFQSAREFSDALAEVCWNEGVEPDRAALAAEVRRLAPAAPRVDAA